RDFHVTGVQTCALPISGGKIYFASGNKLITLSPEGKLLGEFAVNETPFALAANEKMLVVAFEKSFAVYSLQGQKQFQTDDLTDKIGRASCRERVYITGE